MYYGAPLSIYHHFSSFSSEGTNVLLNSTALIPKLENERYRVCVGKEWYRYPSSFFLPTDTFEFSFVESEFRGQLPSKFLPELGTSGIPPNMNAMNEEEPSRYVAVDTCDFMVDVSGGPATALEPNFALSQDWKAIECIPFLDSVRTTNSIARAFYIPHPVILQHLRFNQYCIFARSRQ
eukprot:m.161836 g.161836  ORF g.161836 m.161836 type:complete len:179 (+) comp14367_c5_seq6:161-697(+)